VHCWGGRGRAGLVGACLLAQLYGLGAEEALERVQRSFDTRKDGERASARRRPAWPRLLRLLASVAAGLVGWQPCELTTHAPALPAQAAAAPQRPTSSTPLCAPLSSSSTPGPAREAAIGMPTQPGPPQHKQCILHAPNDTSHRKASPSAPNPGCCRLLCSFHPTFILLRHSHIMQSISHWFPPVVLHSMPGDGGDMHNCSQLIAIANTTAACLATIAQLLMV
jgi:hypothetical protein